MDSPWSAFAASEAALADLSCLLDDFDESFDGFFVELLLILDPEHLQSPF